MIPPWPGGSWPKPAFPAAGDFPASTIYLTPRAAAGEFTSSSPWKCSTHGRSNWASTPTWRKWKKKSISPPKAVWITIWPAAVGSAITTIPTPSWIYFAATTATTKPAGKTTATTPSCARPAGDRPRPARRPVATGRNDPGPRRTAHRPALFLRRLHLLQSRPRPGHLSKYN